MRNNRKPRRCDNTDGARLYPGHKPEYPSHNGILSPTGRSCKGQFDDSPLL